MDDGITNRVQKGYLQRRAAGGTYREKGDCMLLKGATGHLGGSGNILTDSLPVTVVSGLCGYSLALSVSRVFRFREAFGTICDSAAKAGVQSENSTKFWQDLKKHLIIHQRCGKVTASSIYNTYLRSLTHLLHVTVQKGCWKTGQREKTAAAACWTRKHQNSLRYGLAETIAWLSGINLTRQ